jgi:hypothetical protein
MAVYLSQPKAFGLPLLVVDELFVEEKFTFVKSASESTRSKKTSERQFHIPNLSRTAALALFGSGPGLITQGLDMQDPKCFGNIDKNDVWKRTLAGKIVVSQYKTFAELKEWMQNKNADQSASTFRFDFKVWNDIDGLEGFAILGRDAWCAFLPWVIKKIEFVLVGKAALYETGERRAEGCQFYPLKSVSLVYDFADFLRRNALPLSPVAVKAMVMASDPRLVSWSTAKEGEKGTTFRVKINQLDAKNTTVLNLNEWDESLKNFVQDGSVADAYEFYALTPTALSPAEYEIVSAVREYAADKPDTVALCDPLISLLWKPKAPDAYTKYSGTTVPSDHPLIRENFNAVVKGMDTKIIVFAVLRKERRQKRSAPLIAARADNDDGKPAKRARSEEGEDSSLDSVD